MHFKNLITSTYHNQLISHGKLENFTILYKSGNAVAYSITITKLVHVFFLVNIFFYRTQY